MMCSTYLGREAKSLSQWVTLAQQAELEERWSDAHNYWLNGSMACTEDKMKTREMQLNALKVFEKWQNFFESD